MQKQNLPKTSYKGYTLIEILVTIAIISLLAAVAIPQYSHFLIRSKRAEAYIILSGAHKAQLSYYASAEHWFNVCEIAQGGGGPAWWCWTVDPGGTVDQRVADVQALLGLDNHVLSPTGFTYWWFYDGTNNTYWLNLEADRLPDAGFIRDKFFVGVIPSLVTAAGPCGYSDGVPWLFQDDITKTTHVAPGC